MSDQIDHEGVIESIEGGRMRVRIVQQSACSSCKAKSLCSSAESKEKIVDVDKVPDDNFSVGERVVVYADTSVGFTALLLAFIVPLFVMVAGLVIAIKVFHWSEVRAIVADLLLLVVYYCILGAFNSLISKKIVFGVRHKY